MAGPLRPAARNGTHRQHSRQRRQGHQRLRPRSRHPQEPALRPALARRRQGRTRKGLQGTQPRPPRIPRRTRYQVRDLPRLRPVQKEPRLGALRRTRRNLPPVGAHQRLHRPAVDRRNRQAPHQRAILRTALVPQLRRGSRLRQGHPLRPDHLRRPPRTVRPCRRRRSPRTVHPVRPRRRPMAHPAQVLPAQPARPR